MYSLVIVDGKACFLELLGSAFRWDEMGFSLDGSFTCARDALEHMQAHKTDILMTDIELGDVSGLELAVQARKAQPGIEFVILSACSDFKNAHAALRINAFDYLLKPVANEILAECFSALKDALDSRNAGQKSCAKQGDYRIDFVKNHIDKHVGDDMTLECVADTISMNPAYFSRFFKRHTGENFVDYLASRRMEKAIELLRDPRYKAFEIAPMVGYFSKHNFYRRFRQHTGRTPIEYRNEVLRIMDADAGEQRFTHE
ncbi:MAG: helix-turn-helix domain-containing protein [Clostridiales bacterium]|jgi:YesN/AraC family two-component response regulator|nr:helix-turn-helix domain-containing protein [Clostridiales bacterium]